MCGIVGFWNLNNSPVSKQALACFTDALNHRGPDGSGFYIDSSANVGLGHRRLAILDTSESANQPMSFGNERYWITYNGEIYNFLEIKLELMKVGYSFKTDSDTEVILAGYDYWGEDCQLKLNGMWAFAIWDRVERKLFLSRDRFGVKPLIYYSDEKHFAFASEMKAFLALDWFQPQFDYAMIALALSNERMVEGNERCILLGLRNLLGGHCLTLLSGEKPRLRRWWNTLDHLESAPQAYEAQAEHFRELFLDACRIRMRSDVPIGTALSGGLDSSSVLSGMHFISNSTGAKRDRIAGDWQKAFIMTYPGALIDERKYADEMVMHTGAQPVYCTADANSYMDHFDEVLFHLEAISDIHFGPWQIYKTQRENGVVVTMDGHGGDEVLGGYPWYLAPAIRDSVSRFSLSRVIDLTSTLRGLDPFPGENFYLKSIEKFFGGQKNDRRHSWLQIQPADFVFPSMDLDLASLEDKNHLFKSMYVDFHFAQLPTVLRNFDRLSMAHGVEVRAPLMDWRLVCFMFSLPSASKIGGGFTKRILRDSLHDILPESIRTRKQKLGFPNLMEAWTSPRSQEFMCDLVNSMEFQQFPVWNGKKIKDELPIAIRNQNSQQLHKVWVYVQAFSLTNLFTKRKHLLSQSPASELKNLER
ncbi:MAG: asparagine synthase (glutamine-hydrolyzing) [Anaerolineales bacterium]|nr:asparagine synthase (glutamine-hydrolyzing) [Anaerolineales bacterium]